MVGGRILINGKRTATQKYEYRKNLADISAWQFFLFENPIAIIDLAANYSHNSFAVYNGHVQNL